MRIDLYKNYSDTHHVDKNIELVQQLSGTLRGDCSILNPVFYIEAIQDFVPAYINYCYIPEFGRYYFIREIKSIRNRYWAISCHVDVLYTYKDQILSTGAWIARQENEYNLYLDDDKFLINAQRNIWVKAFDYRLPSPKGTFVLTVAGGPT